MGKRKLVDQGSNIEMHSWRRINMPENNGHKGSQTLNGQFEEKKINIMA